MSTRTSPVGRVLLPLDPLDDQGPLRLAAAVLADWFDVPLEIVTSSSANLERCEQVAAGVGVATLPVSVLDDRAFGTGTFVERLGAHAHVVGPAVCVVPDESVAAALVQHTDQPILVPGQGRDTHRIASGPLVVPVSGHPSDLDSLAVAAAWSRALRLGIRLIAATDAVRHSVPTSHEQRLREMGLDVGVDRVTSSVANSALTVAISRRATAIVVAAGWPGGEELLERAGQLGVTVLLAPHFDSQALRNGFDIDFSNSGSLHNASVPPGAASMSRAECRLRIEANSVARIAYVDHGWPVAVPVNYSTTGSDVVIRSLPGGKLEAARRGDIVCLEIDGVDDTSRSGWSVLVHGHLEVIAESSDLRSAWCSDPETWVAGSQLEWLRLVPLSMTGRRIGADADIPVFGHDASRDTSNRDTSNRDTRQSSP